MALIKCPECNKEISDKSERCIHCGYPIYNKNTICIINGISYDLSFLLDNSISIPLKGKQLHLLTKCNLKDCLEKTRMIVEANDIPKILNLKQKEKNEEEHVPRCPICYATNVKFISGLNRGVSVATLGIFSKKINKSFECKNCGYTW